MSNSWGYILCMVNFFNINNVILDVNLNGCGGLGCVIVFVFGNGYKSCVDYLVNNSNVIVVGVFVNIGVCFVYFNYGFVFDIMVFFNNVGGFGVGVRIMDCMGSFGYISFNYILSFGGIFFVCLVVVGVVILVLGYNLSFIFLQVKNILYFIVIDMGFLGDDNEYVNGRVNVFGVLQVVGGGGLICFDGIQNG